MLRDETFSLLRMAEIHSVRGIKVSNTPFLVQSSRPAHVTPLSCAGLNLLRQLGVRLLYCRAPGRCAEQVRWGRC